MAIPEERSHPRTDRRRPIVAAVLVAALLVPLTVLFVAHWRELGAQASGARHERHGVEYLTALSQLTVALTDAQSAAVHGQPVPLEALTRAVDATAEVDERLGEQLRVSERWAQLRALVEQLAAMDPTGPRATFASYSQATNLLLDLHDRLRETSGLIRDVDPDTYYLQDAGGEELPEAIVAAGRLADLAFIASTGPSGERGGGAAEISVAMVAVTGPADDLAAGVQAALDATASRTVSGTVLASLERFLRDKDTLVARVPPSRTISSDDAVRLGQAWADLRVSGADLLTVLFAEIDASVIARMDRIEERQRTAVLAALAAAVLISAGVWLNLLGLRGQGRDQTEVAVTEYEGRGAKPSAPATIPPEYAGWERSGAR